MRESESADWPAAARPSATTRPCGQTDAERAADVSGHRRAASGPEPDPRELSRDELAAYLRSRSTVSVPFAGACCGISRAASYCAARDGSLRTLKLGSRLLVPTSWLEAQLGLGDTERPA